MKKPSFQFYPQDWRSDPGLRACSLEERAVWLELLCLMHDSPRRGVLLLPSGIPMTEEDIARNLGLSLKKSTPIIQKIELRGVSSREEGTGALISRRMVRDEYINQVRSSSGALGGNPALLKQKPSKSQAKAKQKPTPSSSPSPSKEGDIYTSPSAPSRPYGEFGHVMLTESEHAKLTARLNGSLNAFIDRLDRWGEESPAKFRKKKSHYATILNWFDRDVKDGKIAPPAQPAQARIFKPHEYL